MKYLNSIANRWIFSTNHKDIGSLYIIFNSESFLLSIIVMITRSNSSLAKFVLGSSDRDRVSGNKNPIRKINWSYGGFCLLGTDSVIINNEFNFIISLLFLFIFIKLIWNRLKKVEESAIENGFLAILIIYLFSFLSIFLYLFFEINEILDITVKISLFNLGYWLIILKYYLLNRTPDFASLQIWILKNYLGQLFSLFIINFFNFYYSNYSLLTSLLFSILILLLISTILEIKNSLQELFLYQLHFSSILSFAVIRLGKIDWGLLVILILITSWVLPIFFSITELSEEERQLKGEIDVKEVNLRNKIISQIVFVNLTIKNLQNNCQKDKISSLTYLLYLTGFFLYLPKLVGSVIASSIYIAFISNDFTSKVIIKRVVSNRDYSELLINNLPGFQKRYMKRVTEAVIEFAVENPGKTLTVAGGAFAAGVGFIANVFQVEASDRAAEASNRASEASLIESKSLQEYTAESKETRCEENKRMANAALNQGIITAGHKENLITMLETGQFPKNYAKTLIEELEEKNKKDK